jgi:hypothetical protein
MSQAIIDYSTTEGIKLHQTSTASMYGEKGKGFDVTSEEIHNFMNSIWEHSAYNGLNGGDGIMNIPVDSRDPLGPTISMVSEYGKVTIAQVNDHVATYANRDSRALQDSANLFLCIMNSLSEKGKAKVRTWKHEYTCHGHLSGVLLLKVVIRQSCVDTNAATRHIRFKFARLKQTFAKMDHDVHKLNQYVRIWMDALSARGGTTDDLLDQLFKAYKTSPDLDLVTYVATQRNRHDDGEDITVSGLMQAIESRYSSNRAESEDESDEEPVDKEGLIAMQARVTYLEHALAQQASTGGGNSGTKEGASKKRPPMESWKKVPPTAAEIAHGHKKTVKGKEYCFCAKHGYWCAHLTADCKSDIKTSGGKTSEDQKRLVRAMMAVQRANDSSEEDDE